MNPIRPLLGDFMGNEFCILVEDSPSIAANVQRSLQDMGMSSRNIMIARKFHDAEKLICAKRPKLVVTEYEIQGQMGLDLIQLQEEFCEEGDALRVIITKVKSEAAISAAAEEHVDVFILKPFSIETFAQKIDEAVFRKQNPSEYMKTIYAGKKALKMGDFQTAERSFKRARTMDRVPASACYYLGLTYLKTDRHEDALDLFREGKKLQPLNYKCLVAEFEYLLAERRFAEALDVVPSLTLHFPVTAKRLENIYEAVLGHKDYARLLDLHALFLQIEERPEELGTLAAQGYCEGAMHYLKEDDRAKSLTMSEMLFSASGSDFTYIDKMARSYLVVGAADEAIVCFKKISATELGSPRYKLLEFMIDELTATPDQIVEKARRLIQEDIVSPEVFTSAVINCKKIGKKTLGETVIAKAVTYYPDMRSALYKILDAP